MTYLIALFCPPLAFALVGRPVRAILAVLLLALAALTWTTMFGLMLAALTILWACRVVGDRRAERELDGFLEGFPDAKVQHR
jgi:uncharacterized membrane protein YvlD (DUF360 family)